MKPMRPVPNKFQALIESPHTTWYSQAERTRLSAALTSDQLMTHILPSLMSAAEQHYERRVAAIISKTRVSSSDAVMEALWDPHFRKQRNYGPTREAVQPILDRARATGQPITLVALMFTRKNVCSLKQTGNDTATVDLAEIISLIHLNSFARLISRFHPYGVNYLLLGEGRRFLDTFELCAKRVQLYQSRLAGWIDRLELKHLTFIDYEQFLAGRLSLPQQRQREAGYQTALALYQRLMLPIFDVTDMSATLTKAITLDPVLDARNPRHSFVPLWDSIKHSLPYPEITAVATDRDMEYEQLYCEIFQHLFQPYVDAELERLRQIVLTKSWAAAIEHNARIMGDATSGIDVAALTSSTALRTTINPKPDSPHLGIYSVRETTSRVQPWHGAAYIRVNRQGELTPTVLSKLEIESGGGIPICIGSRPSHPFFYAEPAALPLLQAHAPRFTMATH